MGTFDDSAGSSEGVFAAPADRVAALMDLGTSGAGIGPAGEHGGPAAGDDAPPEVPGYRITGRLGEGGMGTVWRAVQLSTHREVALKVMRVASGAGRIRGRFDREVQITARLEHPHIARVYDGGFQRGVCYYAMELVKGLHLDRHVEYYALDRRQVLGLMLLVCRAVAHAHQNGVIHRDLKPANVMVTGDGQPKVLDFGLAKATADGDAGLTVSAEGDLAGTPAFMSPEQAAGRVGRVDTRSDVYSLGVILYRLLTGKSPHELSGSRLELLRRISEQDVTVHRGIGVGKELRAVLLKALANDPERRYATAADLATDIEHLLQGEPVTARPPTLAYVAAKRVRKQWPAVVAAAAVVVVLAVTGVLSYVRVLEARGVAEQRGREAEAQRRLAELQVAEGLVLQGDALGIANRWGEARGRYDRGYELFTKLGAAADRADLGVWESYRWSATPVSIEAHADRAVRGVALSPDGRTALSCGDDGTVGHWDLLTCRELASLKGHHGPVSSVAFAPDGLTALSAGEDATLRLWDLAKGRELRRFAGHEASVWSVAFSPDARFALSAGGDATLRLWDVATAVEVRTIRAHSPNVNSAAFSPDGQRAFSGEGNGRVTLWDLGDGREIWSVRAGSAVRSVAFAPDGRTALSGGLDQVIRLWDVKDGGLLHACRGHSGFVNCVGYSPDSHLLLSAGNDGTIRLYEVQSGREVRSFSGQSSTTKFAAFSPDGRIILSCGTRIGAKLRLWHRATGREVRRLGTPSYTSHSAYAFSRDGLTIAATAADGSVRLLDLATGRELLTLHGHTSVARAIACAPDGPWLLSGGDDGIVRLWDWARAVEVRSSQLPAPAESAAWSPDGRTAAVGCADGTTVLWDTEGGQVLHHLRGHAGAIRAVAFSPDGRRVFSGSFIGPNSGGRNLRMWDAGSGEELWAVAANHQGVTAIAVSPDGKTILTDAGGLFDAETGGALRALQVHYGTFTGGVVFRADGRSVLTGGDDGAIRFFDLAGGHEYRVARSDDPLRLKARVAFAPGGTAAVAAAEDGTLKLWDFSRSGLHRQFEARAESARATLSSRPDDGPSLATLGEWHAFRGIWDWAAELLERARATGVEVSPLLLARCYWELDATDAARREVERAMKRGEAPAEYLKLCLEALAKQQVEAHQNRDAASQ